MRRGYGKTPTTMRITAEPVLIVLATLAGGYLALREQPEEPEWIDRMGDVAVSAAIVVIALLLYLFLVPMAVVSA